MATEEEGDIFDEIEIEEFVYDRDRQIFKYPCPCGDEFEIHIETLLNEENDIATCPSCSLKIKVIYDMASLNLKIAEHVKE
ncbi:hypothetical protein ACOME3_006879 [Neoechinorhynchus agilis]